VVKVSSQDINADSIDSKSAEAAIQIQQAVGKEGGEAKELAVWEEALVQEFIYAIGHLNHVEQHLIEEDSLTGLPLFGDLIDFFREQRKLVGQALFTIEKFEAMRSGTELRSSWESIWCALKHVTTALIHVDECIEKLLKKLRSSGDPVIAENVKMLLSVRKSILEGTLKIIERGKKATNILTEASSRCRDDICLEEVEHR
jgi:hypothetical protein